MLCVCPATPQSFKNRRSFRAIPFGDPPHHTIRSVSTCESQGGNPIGKALVAQIIKCEFCHVGRESRGVKCTYT